MHTQPVPTTHLQQGSFGQSAFSFPEQPQLEVVGQFDVLVVLVLFDALILSFFLQLVNTDKHRKQITQMIIDDLFIVNDVWLLI